MALQTKIKHIDKRAHGVLRFRRRFPKDVAEALGEGFLQVHVRNTEGLAFHREYQAIMDEFDRIVRETRERLDGNDSRTPKERWHEALLRAEEMIAGAQGLEDDPRYAAELIGDWLSKQKDTDPVLLRAVKTPDAPAPKLTLDDAKKMYARDKRLPKEELVRLDRITKRLEEALGPLTELPVENLRREHGRKYMELMLRSTKSDGQPLSIGTCTKEAKLIAALVNHTLREGDLQAEVSNPFVALPWPKDTQTRVEKKLPLSDDLVAAVLARLKAGRTKELPLIWRLLAGTGMRLGEAVGLKYEDIVVAGTDTPHVLVRPNSIRTLKTASSTRSVPLVGSALVAAQEAIEAAGKGEAVFSRYARPRGSDGASAALMKAVRAETKDKSLTVHGLRHSVSNKLRDAGAPVEVRHGFLGHSSSAIAESTYGSPQARLKEFAKWAKEAAL